MTAEIETKVFGEDKFTVEDIGNIIGSLVYTEVYGLLDHSESLVIEGVSGKTVICKVEDFYFVKKDGFTMYFTTFKAKSLILNGQPIDELRFYSDMSKDDLVGTLVLNIKDIRDIYIQDVEL